MTPDSYLKQRSCLCVCLSLLFCLLDPAQAECVKFLIMGDTQKTMGKKYPNVVFFLCGHTRTNRELMAGNDGHKIGWIKTCWHNAELDSFFCVVEVDTTAGSVTCRYYSPLYGEYGDDPSSALYGSDKNPMKYAPEKGPFNHPWTWTGFDFSR